MESEMRHLVDESAELAKDKKKKKTKKKNGNKYNNSSSYSNSNRSKNSNEIRRENSSSLSSSLKEKGSGNGNSEKSSSNNKDSQNNDSSSTNQASSSNQNLLNVKEPNQMMNESEKQDTSKSKLPKSATDILKQWFLNNVSNPYPSQEAKETLSNMTGLTKKQIQNWFTNSRKRFLEPLKKGLEEKKADEGKETGSHQKKIPPFNPA
jgi:hypothetical protein